MPPRKKPLTVEVPVAVQGEIEDTARRTRRSVAFVVRRALEAGRGAGPSEAAGIEAAPLASLTLTTDEDDRPDTISKLQAAAGVVPLGAAIATAWARSRARFFAWAAREESAEAAAEADDLDAGLRDAERSDTSPARLAELASSAYVRVRALVAVHPRTPAEVLSRLAEDPDRVVRAATQRR